jgi:hypothetical protein
MLCVGRLRFPLSGSGKARAVAATPIEGDRDDRRGEARGGAPGGMRIPVLYCSTRRLHHALVAPFVSDVLTLLSASQTVERDALLSREE